MGIDWSAVRESIAKSIERNQHAHGEAVPKLAVSVLALAEAERRAEDGLLDAEGEGRVLVGGLLRMAGHL